MAPYSPLQPRARVNEASHMQLALSSRRASGHLQTRQQDEFPTTPSASSSIRAYSSAKRRQQERAEDLKERLTAFAAKYGMSKREDPPLATAADRWSEQMRRCESADDASAAASANAGARRFAAQMAVDCMSVVPQMSSLTEQGARRICCILPLQQAVANGSAEGPTAGRRRNQGCFANLVREGCLQVGGPSWSRRFAADALLGGLDTRTTPAPATVLARDILLWSSALPCEPGDSCLKVVFCGSGAPQICCDLLSTLSEASDIGAGEPGESLAVRVSGGVLYPGSLAVTDLWDPSRSLQEDAIAGVQRTFQCQTATSGFVAGSSLVQAVSPAFEAACSWELLGSLSGGARTARSRSRVVKPHRRQASAGGVAVSMQWTSMESGRNVRLVIACITGAPEQATAGLQSWLARVAAMVQHGEPSASRSSVDALLDVGGHTGALWLTACVGEDLRCPAATAALASLALLPPGGWAKPQRHSIADEEAPPARAKVGDDPERSASAAPPARQRRPLRSRSHFALCYSRSAQSPTRAEDRSPRCVACALSKECPPLRRSTSASAAELRRQRHRRELLGMSAFSPERCVLTLPWHSPPPPKIAKSRSPESSRRPTAGAWAAECRGYSPGRQAQKGSAVADADISRLSRSDSSTAAGSSAALSQSSHQRHALTDSQQSLRAAEQQGAPDDQPAMVASTLRSTKHMQATSRLREQMLQGLDSPGSDREVLVSSDSAQDVARRMRVLQREAARWGSEEPVAAEANMCRRKAQLELELLRDLEQADTRKTEVGLPRNDDVATTELSWYSFLDKAINERISARLSSRTLDGHDAAASDESAGDVHCSRRAATGNSRLHLHSAAQQVGGAIHADAHNGRPVAPVRTEATTYASLDVEGCPEVDAREGRRHQKFAQLAAQHEDPCSGEHMPSAARAERARFAAEEQEQHFQEAQRRRDEFVQAQQREAARQEAARHASARLEAEQREIERREHERIEAERLEREHRELQRRQQERAEQARLEREQQEARRLQKEREEKERQRLEEQRLALERERQEQEKLAAQRQEAERRENGRLAAEQLERAKLDAVQERQSDDLFGLPDSLEEKREARRLEAQRACREDCESSSSDDGRSSNFSEGASRSADEFHTAPVEARAASEHSSGSVSENHSLLDACGSLSDAASSTSSRSSHRPANACSTIPARSCPKAEDVESASDDDVHENDRLPDSHVHKAQVETEKPVASHTQAFSAGSSRSASSSDCSSGEVEDLLESLGFKD
eukprot:TRINITY_DN110782_c0_g1_i1.p1 TRINITY_DN110782_c0_g1~~TRINITY_DN110782_c0_g1_i1.p1  ORF type:complete len:1295 (+),score=225.81 TRINITY_DN110782_c0_g1_i1:101-3886(+)